MKLPGSRASRVARQAPSISWPHTAALVYVPQMSCTLWPGDCDQLTQAQASPPSPRSPVYAPRVSGPSQRVFAASADREPSGGRSARLLQGLLDRARLGSVEYSSKGASHVGAHCFHGCPIHRPYPRRLSFHMTCPWLQLVLRDALGALGAQPLPWLVCSMGSAKLSCGRGWGQGHQSPKGDLSALFGAPPDGWRQGRDFVAAGVPSQESLGIRSGSTPGLSSGAAMPDASWSSEGCVN